MQAQDDLDLKAAKAAIEADGYKGVSLLGKGTDGAWRAKAYRGTTEVHLMVDGTGMCGGCRVLVNNSSQFACVDGPEFDASLVNFEVLTQRNNMYREAEKASIERLQGNPLQELKKVRDNIHQHECAAMAAGVAHE